MLEVQVQDTTWMQ